MIPDAAVSAVLLGFVLGVQHATDPDHLVAVATIVTRERRFSGGALVGALWGLGHTATLTVAGGLVLLLGLRVQGTIAMMLDLLVAVMIVGLGALRLAEAFRGAGEAASRALLAPGRLPLRALLVGAVHGLAGTAAVSLLVLMTLPSVAAGVLYLGMFGLGTLTGMTALSAAMAGPVCFALKFRRAHRLLSATAGLAAITFGLWLATKAV